MQASTYPPYHTYAHQREAVQNEHGGWEPVGPTQVCNQATPKTNSSSTTAAGTMNLLSVLYYLLYITGAL